MIRQMAPPDFEQLFREHGQTLFGFLAYRVGDPTIAEDLLADTFERAIKAGRRFDRSKGSEQTWIYTIALNCLRDHIRRNKAELRANEQSRGWHNDRSDSEQQVHDRVLLMRALDVLEPGEREVLALRFGADLRVQDIANVTGNPLTTVRGRLYSGLRKLRRELESDAHPTADS